MHFQYLVEDQSGAALIRILMQKIVELYPNATYDCKGFRGIGGFTRKNIIPLRPNWKDRRRLSAVFCYACVHVE